MRLRFMIHQIIYFGTILNGKFFPITRFSHQIKNALQLFKFHYKYLMAEFKA